MKMEDQEFSKNKLKNEISRLSIDQMKVWHQKSTRVAACSGAILAILVNQVFGMREHIRCCGRFDKILIILALTTLSTSVVSALILSFGEVKQLGKIIEYKKRLYDNNDFSETPLKSFLPDAWPVYHTYQMYVGLVIGGFLYFAFFIKLIFNYH
jgi:hypothetical protein